MKVPVIYSLQFVTLSGSLTQLYIFPFHFCFHVVALAFFVRFGLCLKEKNRVCCRLQKRFYLNYSIVHGALLKTSKHSVEG